MSSIVDIADYRQKKLSANKPHLWGVCESCGCNVTDDNLGIAPGDYVLCQPCADSDILAHLSDKGEM